MFLNSTGTSHPTPALWALLDCNSFYCSCERLFRPDLKNKPVAVLSNNDGCLIALTPETKALGYKMGDVYHLLHKKLDRDGVTCFSSNYTLYGDMSQRVMRTMETLVPVEQYSIDESFIPLDKALAAQALDVGRVVHDRVTRWTGLPVRVGIGSTRTLAKLANHHAKKQKNRVFMLEEKTPEFRTVLEETPCGNIWGIGRRMAAKLARHGISNAWQLRGMDEGRALKLLTVVGQRTVFELRGIQCIMEDTAPVQRKTLINSRSFGRRVTRQEDMAEAMTMHASIAAERMRAEGLVAAGLAVFAQTSMHTEKPYHCFRGHVRLDVPTNNTLELVRAAHHALARFFEPGHDYMKGGIMLFDIEEENARQMTLAEACAAPGKQREKALMQALDAINARYGQSTVHLAAQGRSDAFWRMRREKMSGHMTTRWKDLPKVG